MKPPPIPATSCRSRRNNFQRLSHQSNAKNPGTPGKCWDVKTNIPHKEVIRESGRKHLQIPVCADTLDLGKDAVGSSQFRVPHLLQHRQPKSGGKAKVTLVSSGLSFNDLMFLLLRRVMKTSITGA